MLFKSLSIALLGVQAIAGAQDVTAEQEAQLMAAMVDHERTNRNHSGGRRSRYMKSLRAGPRGYNLLEDTIVHKKIIHFDHERVPKRVVHALSHGAYGTFESYRDWSNLTSTCWLKGGAVSEVFAGFSIVVASVGGSESGRDIHGFATKIYNQCGNQDFVGNHHEADKGFPTGGSAHTTAYSFFTEHPEGIPRDIRHISGNGVHTFRFINENGESQLFKWYWITKLGHRSLFYDEVTKIAGKNNNFQRVDLYNNIEFGVFPEWEFAVQLFPDDGTFLWKGIDLINATSIVPFELNPPIKLGKMTPNRNPTNFFAEPESISFAPSDIVDGISFVPDPLLQWHLSNRSRQQQLPQLLFEGASTSTLNDIGGVQEPSANQTLQYTGASGQLAGYGNIRRFRAINNWTIQARTFWGSMDIYAQQHTVDAYRFELGHVADPSVVENYINKILNPIDNCLALRVAFSIGAPMPAIGSGGMTDLTNSSTPYPFL